MVLAAPSPSELTPTKPYMPVALTRTPLGSVLRHMPVALARTPLGSVLRHMPFLEAAYNRRALVRHDQSHLLCGIYSRYEQALSAVPRSRPSGWNNEAAAAIWSDCVDAVRPASYPPFFRCQRLLQPGTRSITAANWTLTDTTAAPVCRRGDWTVVELPLSSPKAGALHSAKGAKPHFTQTSPPQTPATY